MTTPYQPPFYRTTGQGLSLNDRVKEFLAYWSEFYAYHRRWLEDFRVGDTSQFQSIVAASAISPLRTVQPVTGSTTVSTINAAATFSPVTLLAVDGFSTDTAGNIAAIVTLAAGTAKVFYYNQSSQLWYPG